MPAQVVYISYHTVTGAGWQLAAIQGERFEPVLALPERTYVIHFGLADVQGLQQGQVLHHQVQACSAKLCVGHI